ncbi:MurR/RpiR family transcriptional regulator [Bacillus shivajii]|uniref:MurR/RpiR family transcriptional regulator n=1 Tax=Bacillus shivajii TaxID=1983719 RepID=UPI001CFB9193|nr:MurR/RpiR family transcriptional regulator [Bacillus shivajii]UCZ52927.1 MurR/RpiR family transcriptional regulator [Bacillus shivajii]
MERIFNTIKEQQPTFSKGLKKIATHFFNDPKIFAVHSAAQVGGQIGVSETTVIRFCYKLGYDGYKALQEDVQYYLFQKSSLLDYAEAKRSEANHSIKKMMQNDINHISKLIDQLPEKDLEMAVSTIASADRVLVSGVRSSHALASWFAFALDLVIGRTRFYQPNVDDVLLRISELTESSVFVAFSFHRYAVETVQIAKLAKQQGAFVIAFTDSPFSPISEFSDLVMPVQVKSTLDAAPVVFSLMNSIVSTISLRNSGTFQERADRFDSIEAQEFFYKT